MNTQYFLSNIGLYFERKSCGGCAKLKSEKIFRVQEKIIEHVFNIVNIAVKKLDGYKFFNSFS